MHTVVIVVHLMLVLAMIGVVLLQKSEGGGLGSGSTGGSFMTNRGTANVLTRATAILAGGFFLTSLALSIIASHERKPTSIIPASQSGPVSPNGPAAPLGQGGGVLDRLQGGPAAPPAAPAAPSGPQVPQSQ